MIKSKTKFVSVTFVTLVAGVITAIACGWSMLSDHSVRFSVRSGREFYRLPPLPLRYDPVTGKEQTAAEVGDYSDYEESSYEEEQAAFAEPGKVWEKTIAASDAGDLSGLGRSLHEYLDMTKYPNIDESNVQQARRNTAIDLLDAFAEIQHGSEQKEVLEYAKARFAIHNRIPEVEKLIPEKTGDKNLTDNWAYLRAAVLYNSDKKEEALAAFQAHEARFPHSEKHEAVRYMIGRIMVEQSHSFSQQNCGIEGKALWGKEIDPAEIEDPEKCRDKNWRDAMDHFKKMVWKYPNGRYSNDAHGWIAFLYKRGGQRGEALAEYYRLLGQTKDTAWRLEAKKSLQIIGHEYNDQTLDKVEALIADEPDAALAYAYHRIYNHAIDFTYEKFEEWCCTGDRRWSELDTETKRVKLAHDTGRHELERIANFATTMVKRHGRSRVSGDFLLRVAQAQLELQNFKDALPLANQALTRGVTKDSRAQALWIKGSAEHQQKKLSTARATFSQLIKEFPQHKLTEGARRLLAITAEDQDDLETALDLYFDLKYEHDITYFVDVLMPTDRLAQYVAQRTESEHHNTLLYSLGLRYMRERRWNEARVTLRRVRTEKGRDDYLEYEKDKTWFFPKEPGYAYGESRVTYIKTSWVMQDLKTIDIIEYHEKAVGSAEGDEAKAEAMYQLASAYFESDDLAFYNPALWEGARTGSLSQLQFSDHERLPNESRTIFEHLQVHDPWAQAIPIYEQIATRYPNTKTARDALYSVAVAHERLSGRNSVWAEVYERGLFAGPRNLSYADVRNIYPDYQLPRGTYGWEPSTRTVNGGPGWATPPKPLPRLSRVERAQRKLGGWHDDYSPGVVASFRSISQTFIYYLTAYLYGILIALIGSTVWANRSAIYQGPIKNGYALGITAFLYLRRLWSTHLAAALPRLSLLYLVKCLNEYVKGHIKKP